MPYSSIERRTGPLKWTLITVVVAFCDNISATSESIVNNSQFSACIQHGVSCISIVFKRRERGAGAAADNVESFVTVCRRRGHK